MVKDLFLGIRGYGKAITLFNKQKLWYFMAFPILISLCFAFFLYSIQDFFTDVINNYLKNFLNTAGWYDWIATVFDWLISILIFFLTFYLFIKIQKYVVLILLAPILAFVSEKTETVLTKNRYDFDFTQFLKDVVRGITIACINLLIELSFTGVFIIITWIFPLVAPFTTILLLLIGWYFLGYSLLDYTNERHRKSVKDSYQTIWKMKGIAIGNGLVFELMLLIPFVGLVFGPILGAAGATITYLQKHELNSIAPEKHV